MYKTVRQERDEADKALKSKTFSFDQQTHALNTLLEQYEKLKESQLQLVAQNKQLIVSHQKEVDDYQR